MSRTLEAVSIVTPQNCKVPATSIYKIKSTKSIFNESRSKHLDRYVCLFDLILYIPSTIFQLNRDRSSWVEPVLSYDKCVLLRDHNAMTMVRLKPEAPQSQVKHSTSEPLRSLSTDMNQDNQFKHI